MDLLDTRWGKMYPRPVTCPEEHFDAMLAVLNLLAGHRKRLRTIHGDAQVNQELKRRGRSLRIGSNPASRDRLCSALPMEQHAR